MFKKTILFLSLFISSLQAKIITKKNLITTGCISTLAPLTYSYYTWKKQSKFKKIPFNKFLQQELKNNKKIQRLYIGSSLISLGCFGKAFYLSKEETDQIASLPEDKAIASQSNSPITITTKTQITPPQNKELLPTQTTINNRSYA